MSQTLDKSDGLLLNLLMASKLQKSASLILGTSIEKYISKKRKLGSTWRDISRDLYNETDGKINISDVTLIRWNKN